MARATIIFLLVMAAPAAFAQLRESITVELIEVPVYVTAPGGTPVRGLKKEAFSLRVDGKPQPIDYFEEINFAGPGEGRVAAPADQSPASKTDLRQRRLYLLVFDLLFNDPKRLARAQSAADDIVEHSSAASDLFAVATFSARRGFQFVTPFLSDRVAIHRAIATLAPSGAGDVLGLATLKAERAQINPVDLSGVSDFEGKMGSELMSMLSGGTANQESLTEPLRRTAEQEMSGLAAAAERMRRLEGQKHVVVLSSGFGPALGGMATHIVARFQSAVRQIQRAFAGAGVFLDAIDTGGVRAFSAAGSEPLNAADTLRQLTGATGGRLIDGENNFDRAFARLTSAQEVVYLLAFQRRGSGAGTIEVRVDGAPPRSRVSFRTGYGKPAAHGDIDPLQLADIIANDIPQNGVALALGATPRASGAELAISFATAEVMPQIVPKSPWLELLLYVFDEHGATATSKSMRMPFDPAAKHGPRAGVHETVALPPGRYVVKALLNIGGTQSVGFAKRDLVVQ